DTESTRYALGYVRCIPGTPAEIDEATGKTTVKGTAWLASTDTHCLAVVETDGFAECAEFIPLDALPKKSTKGKPPECSLNGEWRNSDNRIAPRVDEFGERDGTNGAGRFPRVADVIPEIGEHIRGEVYANPRDENTAWQLVHFDPEVFARMVAACHLRTDDDRGIVLAIAIPKPAEDLNYRAFEAASDAPIVAIGIQGFGVTMPLSLDGARSTECERYEGFRKRFSADFYRAEQQTERFRKEAAERIKAKELAKSLEGKEGTAPAAKPTAPTPAPAARRSPTDSRRPVPAPVAAPAPMEEEAPF
ncbi:MAG: hypothetical protein NT069_15735, partial [Planctomycetota bacterium]|nr:hypothetical protein [Planctomycetota bacterium]